MNPIRTVVRRAAVPLIVTMAYALLSAYRGYLPPAAAATASVVFFMTALLALAVAWHFRRSRFVFILLPLLILAGVLGSADPLRRDLTVQAAAIVLPIHLIVFTLLRERGIVSIWGMLRAAFVLAEFLLTVYWVTHPYDLLSIAQVRIFHDSISRLTPLNDIALGLGVVAVLFFTLVAFVHPHPIYPASFAGMAVLAMAGLHHAAKTPLLSSLALAGVALIALSVLLFESYRLAFYDELTGLPGRRALMEEMASLGRKYALAMVDIDHFKKFNDTYGHDTGDDVLKMVASVLATVGGGGRAYRYGGEEFTVLFPSKGVDEAYAQIEALRQKIASSAFVIRGGAKKEPGKTVTIHISSGVVERESDEKDPFTVMKRADNALYKAKQKGRNMVIKG